ncbi:hypothetical protein GQ600_19801 [Phytophthora cactorum]|nr:hypothetical protein GQ600_19801 [Phytophthora cactorum]
MIQTDSAIPGLQFCPINNKTRCGSTHTATAEPAQDHRRAICPDEDSLALPFAPRPTHDSLQPTKPTGKFVFSPIHDVLLVNVDSVTLQASLQWL